MEAIPAQYGLRDVGRPFRSSWSGWIVASILTALAVLAGCAYRQASKPDGYYYTVSSGDTLTAIAAIHQTDVQSLALLNGIKNPDLIAAGTRLWIPGDQPTCAPEGGPIRSLAKGIPLGSWSGKRKGERLVWPISGPPVLTSGFGPRWGRMHRGVDLAAPSGTPVLAAADGQVVHIGRNGVGPGRTYGNYVVIHHGDGLYTLYAHLRKVLVDRGRKVKGGRIIGEVGSTGRSTGPHLHFEVIEGITEVDPLAYLPKA